jgi:hypothetical protein
MRQADASLRPADIHSILRVSSIDTQDGDDEFGATTDLTYHRLDIKRALDLTYDRKGGSLGSTESLAYGGNNSALAYDTDGISTRSTTTRDAQAQARRARDGRQLVADAIIDDGGADVGQYASMALDAREAPPSRTSTLPPVT